MKALEKERDELREFIGTECSANGKEWDELFESNQIRAVDHPQYKEIKHVV
jgi:hypothetical protein